MANKSYAEELLLNLLTLKNQMKLYHWQTKSYPRHRASDKFLEKTDDMIDKLIESYQGLYGRIYLKKSKNVVLDNMSDEQMVDFLRKMKMYFKDISPRLFNKKDTELFNIMDEIVANIDVSLYLFTLR